MIDSHCHIDGDEFDADRAEVLARARAAGVDTLVVVGTGRDLAAIRRAADFAAGRRAAGDQAVFATAGVHPHDAARFPDDDWAGLEALAASPAVVAVGETGLDYHYDFSPPAAQGPCFRRQIQLARRVEKPVVCHVREAHAEALALLVEERAAEVGAVIHCFTGNAAEAAAYVAAGFHVSISGIVTFKGKSADPIREAAAAVPADRLLLETDAPYLAPVPLRGKRNEPGYLPHTAAFVAALRGVAPEVLADQAAENTRRFFHLTHT